MKLRLLAALFVLTALSALAQNAQPPGVADALANLSTEPSTHTAFALDRDTMNLFLSDGQLPPAALTGINFERYSYHAAAFYTPEAMHALLQAYDRAGWHHLVDANAGPGQSASPDKPLTDLWLHFHGTEVDHLTVLIRAPRAMNVIEVSGMLRPLDLVHLGGHFGIPKVDPNAVMVPAPPGK